MAISTNQKPTIYRNLYENTAPADNQEKLGWGQDIAQRSLRRWASIRTTFCQHHVLLGAAH